MGHILVLKDYSSSFLVNFLAPKQRAVYGCQANKDLANVTRSRAGTRVLLGAVIVSIGAGDDGDRTGGLGVAALITAVLAVTSKGVIRTGFGFLISSTTGGSSVGSYCAAESTTLIDMVTANEAD